MAEATLRWRAVEQEPKPDATEVVSRAPAPEDTTRHHLTTEESRVLHSLGLQPTYVEALATASGLDLAATRRVLATLSRVGLATRHPDRGWSMWTDSPTSGYLRRPLDVVTDRFAMLHGDAEDRLGALRDGCVDVVVTSSPYYRERRQTVPGQLGWERTPKAFASRLLDVLSECSRALATNGLIFLNFDDHKDDRRLACIDHEVMNRRAEVGLDLLHEVTWRKTCSLPNGSDVGLAHVTEKVFLLTKVAGRPYWDAFRSRQPAKGGGSRRLTDFWETVWDVAPAPQSVARGVHFATFPKEFVRRCLSIGASERGYCRECGAPWERVVKRGASSWSLHSSNRRPSRSPKADDGNARDANGNVASRLTMAEMSHVGWARPNCGHGGEPRKALVLDPFSGSATTGVVALEMGHDYVGIDIDPACISLGAAALGSQLPRGGA